MASQRREHRTFCRICPVLCGLVVETDGDHILDVRGDKEHPISRGYTCPKGRAAGAFHHHPERLDGPRLRGEAVSWDAVLDDLAAAVARTVEEHGPDAVGVYWGTWSWMDGLGRLQAESLFRQLGTRSRYSAITVDAIARLTIADLLGGTPALIPAIDEEHLGLTVLVGTNPVVSHGHACAMADPVTTLRRIAADHGLFVLDPVRTATSRLATCHLPVRPGSDPAVLAAVVRSLLDTGADTSYLADHATGVEELRAAVAPWTTERAAVRAGLAVSDLERLIEAVRRSRRVTVLTGTGTTMAPQATITEWLAWVVQIVTGSFEAEGGAWFNPGAIARADRFPPARVEATAAGPPSRPDLRSRFGEYPCAALADEIEAGKLRVLFVVGGDPLTALPNSAALRRAFSRLDALAVFDVVEAETVRAATHVLAVAGQLEREDLTWFTERFAPMIAAQWTAPVLAPTKDRRTVADVAADLGRRLGLPEAPNPWPRLDQRAPGLRDQRVVIADPPRLRGWVHDSILPGGRWQVAPPVLVEQLGEYGTEPPTEEVVALPRRALRRMNSTLRDVARGGEDRAVWVHPATVEGVADGDRVVVASAVGSFEATARVTTDIVPGAASVPHGLPDQNVNLLTTAAPGAVDRLTAMITQSGIPVTVLPSKPRR